MGNPFHLWKKIHVLFNLEVMYWGIEVVLPYYLSRIIFLMFGAKNARCGPFLRAAYLMESLWNFLWN